MGMETLNNAVRAAGFAMAASDEPYGEVETVKAETSEWQPADAVLRAPVVPEAPRSGEWFRSVLGLFGRRAPASPA